MQKNVHSLRLEAVSLRLLTTVIWDSSLGLERYEAFYRSRIAQTVRDPKTQIEFASLVEDELVMIEVAHKVFLS
jgi:hypothetical protein